MTKRYLACFAILSCLGACGQPPIKFEPSQKSALQLRAVQVRLVVGEPDSVTRAVVDTLHDLGYRITRADATTRTVSATRQTELRVAVVVKPRPPGQSVVRANATIIGVGREAQIDSPEFYSEDFFRPLAATLKRDLAMAGDHDEDVPAPTLPIAERNSSRSASSTSSSSPNLPVVSERPQ